MNIFNEKNDEKNNEKIDETLYFNLDTNDLKINYQKLQKMAFIYNALENGWEIKKNNDKYIFIKKHNGKKEYIHESYLNRFIKQNINMDNLELFIKK